MTAVPARFASTILCFAGLFRHRTWRHAHLLLVGAVLVPGVRTVASVLRVLGLAGEAHFVNFHRVLSRAVWSPRAAARLLLGLLVRAFVPEGPIVLGIDDTIERRRAVCTPAAQDPWQGWSGLARKGARLPALAQVLDSPTTRWQRVVVPHGYGLVPRPIEIASGCALWYHPGKAALPIGWMLIRDPLRRFDAQARW